MLTTRHTSNRSSSEHHEETCRRARSRPVGVAVGLKLICPFDVRRERGAQLTGPAQINEDVQQTSVQLLSGEREASTAHLPLFFTHPYFFFVVPPVPQG